MRVAFAGTPEFADRVLAGLLDSGHEVVRVLTQPQRPTGRGRKTRPSPVHVRAEKAGIEVHTPERLKGHEHLLSDLDLLVVAAYGLILRRAILDAPRFGCINVHASLLPRWRGAAPVERAIMAGDESTGVSIMQMEAGLDTGPVHATANIPINDQTGAELTMQLADLGTRILIRTLDHWPDLPPPTPQDEDGANYADKLTAADSRIDWREDAETTERRIRALSGRQAAFATLGELRIRILAASVVDTQLPAGVIAVADGNLLIGCARQSLAIDTVQLNRGKGTPMRAIDAANGYPEVFADGVQLDV